MFNPEKVEEWVREVEARPASAALIIQYISRRLADLTARNEDLLKENIELRSGRKVEEYDSRIANLEYQVDLLKRQLSGAGEWLAAGPVVETISLILYNALGQVLRVEIGIPSLKSRQSIAALRQPVSPTDAPPRLLVTNAQEELAFIFDSGRAVARAVTTLPALEPSLDWSQAALVEPRGNEEMTVVTPVGRMALYDCCVQISRRALWKKIMRATFETNLTKEYIGSGIKAKPDKNCVLALCAKDDRFVQVSREGYVSTSDISGLPYTSEESFKLGVMDYIVSGFPIANKPWVLFLTHNGKAIHREVGWLEPAESNKSRGQPILSPARREAGVRLVGAAAVDEADWAAVLRRDGQVMVYQVADLVESGSVGDEAELVDFVPFRLPNGKKNGGG